MWRIDAVVRGRRDPDLCPFPVDGISRQRHPVLPADQSADPRTGCVHDPEIVAGPDSVEQTLVLGRHQLPVAVQEPLGAEVDDGVVERPRTDRLPLVDADHAHDPASAADVDQPVDQRPGYVDGVLPQPLPQGVPASEPGGLLGPRVRGIQRDEALRQHRQLRTAVGRLLE
jgi:hypothetical protein